MKSLSQLFASTVIRFFDGLREVAREEQPPYKITRDVTHVLVQQAASYSVGTQLVLYVTDDTWSGYAHWEKLPDDRKWAGWDRRDRECVLLERHPEPRGVWRLVFEVRKIGKKAEHCNSSAFCSVVCTCKCDLCQP